MFGDRYVSLDVSAKDPDRYGRELLAEILNHANALKKHWWAVYEQQDDPGGTKNPDFQEAVLGFFFAADIFLDTCDEARIRGRRMRLVTHGGAGGMVFNADGGIESNDDINKMGGYLVPTADEVEDAKIAEAQKVFRAL